MDVHEIDSKVKELRELKRMSEELKAEMDSITDELKAHMDANHMETVLGLDYKISYTTVISTRIDTTALKKALPDVAEKFSKTTETRRFTIV